MKISTRSLSLQETLTLIEKLHDAELCRDFDESRRLLEPILPDIEKDPVLDGLPLPVEAELLRLCGCFFSLYARAKNKRHLILRGKDLITRAINLFEYDGAHDKAAEARTMLGHCYWLTGEIDESNLIFDQVEAEFKDNVLHPVYLQAKIYRLMIAMWSGTFQEALSTVKGLVGPMTFCKDKRLLAMFHNHAGRIFQGCDYPYEAEFHYMEAIRTSKAAGNDRFVAINLNNLGYLFNDLGRCDDALMLIDQAIERFKELNDAGWVPHAIDTRALILINKGNLEEALNTIDGALQIFETGDDYAGLVDSMWTKCRCLLRMDRRAEAVGIFAELHRIAMVQIGEKACHKYANLFADEIHAVAHLPLTQEVSAYKKRLVENALVQSNGNIKKASEALRLNNHQALSEILNKQFPELYSKLGIERRKRRSDAKNKIQTSNSAVKDCDLARIDLRSQYRIDNNINPENIDTYFCSYRLMASVGVEDDSVLAVLRAPVRAEGLPILYEFEQKHYFARVERDVFTDLLCVTCPGSDIPLPLGDEIRIIGSPIAHFPVELLETETTIEFHPLTF